MQVPIGHARSNQLGDSLRGMCTRFTDLGLPHYLGFLLAAFLLLHFGLRLAISSSLQWDEAEQQLFAQQWAWGYSGQPPLYTWLVNLSFALLGPTIAAHAALKMALLGGLLLGLYRTARLVGWGPKAVALATGTLLLFPYFSWELLRDGSHTVLLCAIMVAIVHRIVALQRCPSNANYVLLGLLLGLGFLSKYTFVLFAPAILLAALLVPPYRRLVMDRRLILTLLAAALTVTPHIAWMFHNYQELWATLQHRAEWRQTHNGVHGRTRGLLSFAWNLLVVWSPALLLLAVGLGQRRLVELWQASMRPAERFILLVILLGEAALLSTVLSGVEIFYSHWFLPLLALVPLVVAGLVARLPASDARRRWLAAAVLGVLLVSLAARATLLWLGGSGGGRWYEGRDALYAAAAADLAEVLTPGALLLCDDHEIAGNLKLRFPAIHVGCVSYRAAMPRVHDEPPRVVLAWNATKSPTGPARACVDWLHDLGIPITREANRFEVAVADRRADRRLNRIGLLTLKSIEALSRASSGAAKLSTPPPGLN
jgi:4-amino-4-deoxy-L-arabinose transferase-like glycosyltransferase